MCGQSEAKKYIILHHIYHYHRPLCIRSQSNHEVSRKARQVNRMFAEFCYM